MVTRHRAATSSEDARRTRRNAAAFGGTALALGLLMLFPTSTDRTPSHRRPGTALAPAGVVPPAPQPDTSSQPSRPAPGSPGSAAAPPVVPPARTPATVTVNGTSVDTRYGPVQVQVTMRGGTIVAAHAIDHPNSSGQDQEINSQAVPLLDQETLAAQNAHIDTVSGATYTSQGYRTSLQAALDAAHPS